MICPSHIESKIQKYHLFFVGREPEQELEKRGKEFIYLFIQNRGL